MKRAIGMMKMHRLGLLAGVAMTPMERRVGRFMRAPDHPTGDPAPAGTPPADPSAAADPASAADPAPAGDPPANPGETMLGGEPEGKTKGGDPDSPDDEGGKDKSDAAAALIGAPESYAFDLGEGVNFDQEAFDLVEPVLREMDLSQDAAGRIVGAYAEKVLPMLQQRAEAQATQAGEELRADWAKQTMADTEVGGTKLAESKAMAARAMAHFLPQGEEGQRFRTFLNESGLGNHPEMMRILARAGRELGEATADKGTTAKEALSSAEKFYGKGYGKQQ
ncbi:peptidase [Sphingobium sp. CAP-1]|uniref:peptidase n=1 Tax=Sphingobium sp. CAP-1 TaxID=2676077 RepID=UPI0012BB48C8|nr:peptidase [Sphingobium sp. CAP-1]QGP80009.1 peptidase [Sphingobium sp. CAP-1]